MDDLVIESCAHVPGFRRPRGKNEYCLVARGPRLEGNVRHFFARIVPILQEGDLKRDNSRTFELKMSIPPSAKRAQPKIFITGIKTSKEGYPSINNDQLPMVAEVDLKTSSELSIGDKSLNEHACIAQLRDVGVLKPLEPTTS